MMRPVLTVELALAALLAFASLAMHVRSRRPGSPLARLTWWQLVAAFGVMGVEAVTLLLVLYRVHWPWWILALVYGGVDAVMAGWLLLRLRARREERAGR